MKGVVLAIAFFTLGVMLSPYIQTAEWRLAASDEVVDSAQRVQFDSISVYPDEVRIDYPGLKYARVASNSMAPWLTDKSVVFEKPVESADEVREGDVISFYEPSVGGTVLHMVVDITDEGFITQGLANDAVDDWVVPFDSVIGVMVGSFR
jgi:signal peptidase I